MIVVGLDLSLTQPGIAVFEDGHVAVTSVKPPGPKTKPSLVDRIDRIDDLASDIHKTMPPLVDLVVIEAPAFSRNMSGTFDRSGLWWQVAVGVRYILGADIVEVSPTTRAKYATGRGNAGKDEVLLAVSRRYPDVAITNNDEADALVLAAMGARHLDAPIEASLPQAHLEAMRAVRWPESTGARS